MLFICCHVSNFRLFSQDSFSTAQLSQYLVSPIVFIWNAFNSVWHNHYPLTAVSSASSCGVPPLDRPRDDLNINFEEAGKVTTGVYIDIHCNTDQLSFASISCVPTILWLCTSTVYIVSCLLMVHLYTFVLVTDLLTNILFASQERNLVLVFCPLVCLKG